MVAIFKHISNGGNICDWYLGISSRSVSEKCRSVQAEVGSLVDQGPAMDTYIDAAAAAI